MPCVCEAVDFWLYWLRYALNNPLIYTDPSGYKFKLWKALLFAPFGLAAISPGTKYASGEASLGQAVGEYVVNAAAFIASGSIGVSVPGIDGAILGGMASGAISGGGMVAVNGGNFEDIIGGIAMGANIGALAGAVSYGVIAGLGAAANGLENARFGSMDLNAFGDFGGFRINNGSFQWMPAVNGNIFNGVGLSLASAMSSGLAGVSASSAVMGLIPASSGRPPRISKYADGSISEQIVNWMEYIEANPRKNLYHNDLIAPDIFSNPYTERKGLLNAVSGRETSFGGTEYTIINPITTAPNNDIAGVKLLRQVNRLSVRLYPNCGNCRGADVINIHIYSNKQYNSILNRIFLK